MHVPRCFSENQEAPYYLNHTHVITARSPVSKTMASMGLKFDYVSFIGFRVWNFLALSLSHWKRACATPCAKLSKVVAHADS